MPRRLRRLGIALALSATALGAEAAGLGRLNLLSALGQPLRAEIELTALGKDDAGVLSARLANADAFSQAGIEYGPALANLRFSIQRRASGQQYILVTSNQQVNEPFLDLLVELTWGSGRLVREYTVLLDPPETRTAQRDNAALQVQAQTPAAPVNVRRAPPAAAPEPSGAPVASAPARSPAAAPAPSANAGANPGGTYLVQSGDTAMSIARNNKADDVSLEKMLAALYRDNQQAFAGNINRLLAGATLKIPDGPSAQALDNGEARRIIAQTSNFGSYREKLAANAAQAPTLRAPGQQASGRLSSQVEDRTAPTEANDRLQLSRPDANRATAGTGAARAGSGNGPAGPTAGDLAAKDRELQETRTRLALLEKNVADLQELLKLKNQTLADLQKNVPAKGAEPAAPAPAVVVAPPAAAPVATPPVADPTPAPSPAPAAVAPTPSPVVTPPAPTPAPAAVAPAPSTPVAPPPGAAGGERWYDSLFDNSLLLVGLIVVALLAFGGWIFLSRRRRIANFEDSIFVDNSVLHANSVFGTTGGQSVDTANSGFHSNFVPVAGNLPEHNEVDPVAEADVYIAYGRDAQAEEILKEALRADNGRQAVRLKLLEIYARRGDAKTFETMATELYAATGGQGDEWRQAAALGLGIDPRNPLYSDPVPNDEPVAALPATPRPAPPVATAIGSQFGGAGSSLNFGMSSLGLNTGLPSPEERGMTQTAIENAMAKTAVEHARTEALPMSSAAAAPPSMDLDFDLGNGSGVAPLKAAAPPATPTAKDGQADMTASAVGSPLIDPFTASAFGSSDASARTAVNLPAFRARAESQAPPAPATTRDADGFTASDIFGSSIIADDVTMYGESLKDIPPSASLPERMAAARPTQFPDHLANRQFDKTEALDAFSSVNLDLDASDMPGGATSTDFGAKTDVWQAMATKLDLALAYSDIGDKDGARELLEEVVRSGDPVQSDRARQLITELG